MVSTRRTGALRAAGSAVAGLLLATVLTSAGLLLSAGPARAADVFVQVTPSTVRAGLLVGIRASCTDNSAPATVESPAFGTVTAQPQDGYLTAAAMVPEGTQAGTFRVRLTCPNGRTASTMLNVVAGDRPSRGPATGFGGAASDSSVNLLLAGGLAITVFGAVLGVVALRRRARPAARRPAGSRMST